MYVASVALFACSSESASSPPYTPNADGDATTSSPEVGGVKRSPACLALQDALCDYASDLCATGPRGACDEIYGSVFCSSDDAVVSACVESLRSTKCNEQLSASCDAPFDVRPAQELCVRFVTKYCAHRVSCGVVTEKECEDDLSAQGLECSLAVGIGRNYDQCLADAQTRSCNAANTIPDTCDHTFYTSF